MDALDLRHDCFKTAEMHTVSGKDVAYGLWLLAI